MSADSYSSVICSQKNLRQPCCRRFLVSTHSVAWVSFIHLFELFEVLVVPSDVGTLFCSVCSAVNAGHEQSLHFHVEHAHLWLQIFFLIHAVSFLVCYSIWFSLLDEYFLSTVDVDALSGWLALELATVDCVPCTVSEFSLNVDCVDCS